MKGVHLSQVCQLPHASVVSQNALERLEIVHAPTEGGDVGFVCPFWPVATCVFRHPIYHRLTQLVSWMMCLVNFPAPIGPVRILSPHTVWEVCLQAVNEPLPFQVDINDVFNGLVHIPRITKIHHCIDGTFDAFPTWVDDCPVPTQRGPGGRLGNSII